MDRSKAILVLLALCALQCFTSDNYIVNGDLSTPSLPTGHVSQLFMGGVLGWNANLLLLTLGSTYNSKVCKDMPFFNLDSIPNQMVSQSVMLPNPGKYVLSFEWAPSEAGVNTSTGEVRFNGHLVSVLQS